MKAEKSFQKNMTMSEQVIICPNCQTKIPLTEAISHQIREKMHKEFETEFLKKEKEFKEKFEKEAKQKAEEAIAIDLEDLRGQISEKDKKLKEAQKAELDLRKQKRELEDSKRNFELEKAKKHEELEAEFLKKEKEFKEKFEKEARQKAQEAIAIDLEDLRGQISEKDKKLKEAQKAELDLRKQKRELEDSKRNFELEMAKKLDEEREKIRDMTLERAKEEHKLKDLEKDKKIAGMLTQIDELKRKAEQGSQQTQGEALEQELEDILKSAFLHDDIEPVPKGIRGADVLQRVHTQQGACCGTIIWESKNAKIWKDSWIVKLKDDKIAVGADIAVLMTTTLPNDVKNFAHYKGAWVTNYTSIVGLATALRINLIEATRMKLATEGKNSKMEVLYNYLSGSEFRQKVEAIVEAFESMKKDLEKEKRAMMSIWSKREKQIERVIFNTATMYGDMQGIIGASMPQIESLELKALPAGTDFGEFKGDDEKDEIFEHKIPNEESLVKQIDTQLLKKKSGENISEIIEDLDDEGKNKIFELKTQNKGSIDKKIYTQFTKEKSGKNNPEISEMVEDLDEDELEIYNCLKNDFSGEAETGDISMKLRMGSFLVGNRFNRLKSKGLVTEIRNDEGGINWRIVI
ncbi:MAG: DUF2130 domain-containing protein [Candidatus Methanoperedens sp.]|nr:DUF2130 domain-containing protein [Candidatus Methanoperedens sp.]